MSFNGESEAMTDTIPSDERSWLMSRIKSADTQPEMIVRSTLHRLGFRFSLRRRDLPGKPDVVMRKWKCVIFVHGCFWHRHPGCPIATMPKSRIDFWQDKFRRNVERDTRVKTQLEDMGWKVVVVWECETRDRLALATRLAAEITAHAEKNGAPFSASSPDSASTDDYEYPTPSAEKIYKVAEEVARYGRDLARQRRGHYPSGRSSCQSPDSCMSQRRR